MSSTARDHRGSLSRLGIAASWTFVLVAAAASCSRGVHAGSKDTAQASPEFEAELSASWEDLIAHSQRISPATNWDGSLDGLKTLWHDSGAKQGEGRFVQGRKEDNWTFWYENGQKRWEGSYHRDQVHGVERSWYPNGALCYEGTSVEGKRHGLFRAWYEDGQPWWQGEYQVGVRQGPFRYWHRDGSPDKKVSGVYVDGKRVKSLGADLADAKD
jgi:hypothetical protein